MTAARFEVVHTDAGWFARFIASNGREVWRTSETYKRERTATRAIRLASDAHSLCPCNDSLEVRLVDEREP